MRYKCRFEKLPPVQNRDANRMLTNDWVHQYRFDLDPIIEDKPPIKARDPIQRIVKVVADHSHMNCVKRQNKSIPDAIDRMLFFLARQALITGKDKIRLDMDREHAHIDVESVVIPHEPFELAIESNYLLFDVS